MSIWSSPLSRRTAIGAGLAALAVANPFQSSARSMTVTADLVSKIDTHQHFLPRVYVEAVGLETLAGVMPNGVAPDWSAERALSMMEANGIGMGVISISSGPVIPDAPVLLRKCNDEAAALKARFPGRFGSFASLPLPDIDASLREIEYSLDTLKAQGVILFTNYDGRYLGDPMFAPVLAELNRRKAVAFIHPNEVPYHLTGLPPASVLEFPFDTTRTAASLIFAGAMSRYPDVRFILSHAGGTLPYLAQRIAGAVMMTPALAERIGDPLVAIKSFWFDTALSAGPASMAALMTMADPARIVFGSDFPMAPPSAIAMTAQAIDRASMDEDQRALIQRGSAETLLA